MRIKKDSVQPIVEGAARFLLVADAMDGEILLQKDGAPRLTLSVTEEGSLTVNAYYSGGEVLTLKAEGAFRREVILTQGYARLALYVDGVLLDEDFFLGEMDFSNSEIHTKTYMHFEAGFEYHSAMESTPLAELFPSLPDGFRPIGREMGVLSVRPAVLSDRLHLFYIDTRRGGAVKSGNGAFRVAALYSENGCSFGTAPVSVPVDERAEYGALDAACLFENGRSYLYYLTRRQEGVFLRVAVSEDGFSFLKTGLDVDVPDLLPADVTAIDVFQADNKNYLLYAQSGRLFAAESQDLLHFSAPVAIETAQKVQDFCFFEAEGEKYMLLVGESGVSLCRYSGSFPDGTLEAPMAQDLDMEKPRAVFYRNSLYLCGVKDGALAMKRAYLQNGKLSMITE